MSVRLGAEAPDFQASTTEGPMTTERNFDEVLRVIDSPSGSQR